MYPKRWWFNIATKKRGRPTSEPKENQLRIRLSNSDIDKLNICSESLKKTKTDIVRLGIEKVYQEIKK